MPITLATGHVGTAISVGAGPSGIAISPDGSKMYVASGLGPPCSGTPAPANTVTPISLPSGKAATALPVTTPDGLAFAPDGKTAYVTDINDSELIPITTASNTLGTALAVNPDPADVAISPDQAPVANFAVTSAPPGEATSVDASPSTVAVGSIVSYAWSFGDGSTQRRPCRPPRMCTPRPAPTRRP